MKTDMKIGVILGVIILAIIVVFLSTRTAVKEPVIPFSQIIEEGTRVETVEIGELPQDPSNEAIETARKETDGTPKGIHAKQKATSAQDNKETAVQEQVMEKPDTLVEGQWRHTTVAKTTGLVKESNNEEWKDILSEDVNNISSNVRIHKVQYRDSLRKLAKKYYGDESKWSLIFKANLDRIQDPNIISVGTELVVPLVSGEKISQQEKAGAEVKTPVLSHVSTVQESKPDTTIQHEVQKGETLYSLAGRYYNDGSKWKKIYDANRKVIESKNSLKVGQKLAIPDPLSKE